MIEICKCNLFASDIFMTERYKKKPPKDRNRKGTVFDSYFCFNFMFIHVYNVNKHKIFPKYYRFNDNKKVKAGNVGCNVNDHVCV